MRVQMERFHQVIEKLAEWTAAILVYSWCTRMQVHGAVSLLCCRVMPKSYLWKPTKDTEKSYQQSVVWIHSL